MTTPTLAEQYWQALLASGYNDAEERDRFWSRMQANGLSRYPASQTEDVCFDDGSRVSFGWRDGQDFGPNFQPAEA